ncbi:hypothetical protein C8R44DRAFT_948841 [Mycena epipterygia]|nr:hypothetical protein C8R44DRAFT_948841 [Mycena epipterygia]
MVYKRAQPSSDYGLDFVPPPKCLRRALSLPPSSPPRPDTPDDEDDTGPLTPVAGPRTPDSDDSVEAIDFLKPLPALLFPESSTVASGSAQAPPPQTPSHRGTQRAESLEPRASSPMSIVDITPLKPKNKRGRPTLTPQTRLLRQTVRKLSSSQRSPDKRTYDAARETLQRKATALAKERAAEKAHEQQVEADLAAARKAEEQAAIQTAQDAEDTRRAQEVIRILTTSEENGGFNFTSLEQFFDALWRKGGDAAISAKITKYIQRHGAEHAKGMFKRSKEAKEEYISDALAGIFQREGRAIQAILTRDSTTTVTALLQDFSMDNLAEDIQAAAPHWLCSPTPTSLRGEKPKATIGATKACVVRSQKANNFQLVIGLFLLGSGASKREIEVLAHAGLSVSYSTINDHVKQLSKEGLAQIREVVKSGMVQIVWDNLNIAFKVAAQRLNSKSHFDNGTTSTMIPVFDPATGVQAVHGTLPLEMKPPRERTLPVCEASSPFGVKHTKQEIRRRGEQERTVEGLLVQRDVRGESY